MVNVTEEPNLKTQAGRLRAARMKKFRSMRAAAREFDWNENTYKSHELGIRRDGALTEDDARRYARAFGVTAQWLLTGRSEESPQREAPPLVPILGIVGARAGDEIVMTTAQAANDFAPIPPGGTTDSVALEVSGHSMRGYADDGALIYFEIQRTPPSPDMLGQIVIAETVGGQVLLKRLLRGSAPDLYDLESFNDAPMRDVRLKWAAEPTAIIPPKQARKIILRGGVDV